MSLLLGPAPVAIRQKISNATAFDGLAPTGASTQVGGVLTYAASAHGGLFDFEQTQPIAVVAIELGLGGQTAWSLDIAETGIKTINILTGTTETSKYITPLLVLSTGQTLVFTTTGNITTGGVVTIKVVKCLSEAGIFIR